MPTFKSLIQARKYGEKNYLIQKLSETIHGNWKIEEGYETNKLTRLS